MEGEAQLWKRNLGLNPAVFGGDSHQSEGRDLDSFPVGGFWSPVPLLEPREGLGSPSDVLDLPAMF